MSSSITHGCTANLGHLRPGRTERLAPPSGGPRERCPFLFADRRRPAALCLEKHRAGWFQFLRTRIRHRVTGAQGTTASLHIVITSAYAIGE